MQISFSDDAYETFQTCLAGMPGYAVTVKTVDEDGDGEEIEAVLLGPDLRSEWGDAVRIQRVDEEWNAFGPVLSVRAENVYVH